MAGAVQVIVNVAILPIFVGVAIVGIPGRYAMYCTLVFTLVIYN